MSDTVHCHSHGESEATIVCNHLTQAQAGLGFNCAEPSEKDPFPDAWCDDCELILEAHGGWNDESEKLIELRVLCSRCYELSRIRNTHTDMSFEDLSSLRWKCSSCEEWHYGPCLDFFYDSPVYWSKDNDVTNQTNLLRSGVDELPTNFLNEDFCILDGENYFVRGVIPVPIIGSVEMLRWGVWGSLSQKNFKKLLLMNDDPQCVELPPMFSWLSSEIEEYPDTRNLKMYAHIQEPGTRPIFELELTDHPLSQEYHYGITPERVKEIMIRRLDLPLCKTCSLTIT